MIAAALGGEHLEQAAQIEAAQPGHNALGLAGLQSLASRDAFRGFGLLDPQDAPQTLVSHAVFLNAGASADLVAIATLPQHQRKGHASSLLRHGIDGLLGEGVEEVFLEVARDNAAARALYAKTGFVEIASREGYYVRSDGVMDAVVMRLDVAGSGRARP